MNLHVIELITSQKLIAKTTGKYEGNCLDLCEVIELRANMQGSFNFIPYTALGKLDSKVVLDASHIICSYELDDKTYIDAHAEAWAAYRSKKSGIVVKPNKLDLV